MEKVRLRECNSGLPDRRSGKRFGVEGKALGLSGKGVGSLTRLQH